MLSDNVLAVLTFKSVDTILECGGTQSLVLDRQRAKTCKYAVVCRNAYHEKKEGDELHGHAFIIGKIKDVVPSTDTKGRWLVLCSDYASGDFGYQWEGRNPVAYGSTDHYEGSADFKKIDFDALTFKPMPELGQVEDAVDIVHGLSLAEAKAAVAARYEVDPVMVEICVRA